MSKPLLWTGRALSALTGLLLIFAGVSAAFLQSPETREGFEKFGYPASAITPIGLSALVGALLYLYPRTAPLGAIVLTGYLGGAVSTHVRAADGMFFIAVIVGILLWLGLYLRDGRIRALLPVRRG